MALIQIDEPAEEMTFGDPHKDATDVSGSLVLGYDTSARKWMALRWNAGGAIWLAGGGKEEGESYYDTAVRELAEETGYRTFGDVYQLGAGVRSYYYNEKKDVHRRSYSHTFLFELDHTAQSQQSLESHEDFSVVWLELSDVREGLLKTGGGVEHWLNALDRAEKVVAERLS